MPIPRIGGYSANPVLKSFTNAGKTAEKKLASSGEKVWGDARQITEKSLPKEVRIAKREKDFPKEMSDESCFNLGYYNWLHS